MKLIVGLGNPGSKYKQTRHNAGFLAVDFFLQDKQAISCASKFKADICEYLINDQKFLFVKPTTFMNLSGEVVQKLVTFYSLKGLDNILVLHDEIDLPFGKIKTTEGSSAAGHNGVQNIIDLLGTKEFPRVRIGVESRETRAQIPTDAFVLQNFSDGEIEILESKVFPETNKLIEDFLAK